MTEREERQQHVTQPTVKLSPFWPQAPALWFAQAECSFTVKKIVAQFNRYCHVVAALPHESLRLAARLAAGLCIKHWRYCELASSCTTPCSWQGNGGAGGN